jgi:hypothetical protein
MDPPLFFFILLPVAAIGFVLHVRFLRALRSRHESVWEALGSPTPFANNSMSNSLAVIRYLWRKDYETIDDPAFVSLARMLRIFSIAYLIFFVAIFVFGLI